MITKDARIRPHEYKQKKMLFCQKLDVTERSTRLKSKKFYQTYSRITVVVVVEVVIVVGDRSRGRTEGSLFNSYYTEV